MTPSKLVPDATVPKNQTSCTITRNSEQKTESSQKNRLIISISILILALLAVIMIGGFIAALFSPKGIYIGITALISLLIGIILFPLMITCSSKPPVAHIRPRDLDLSKLDVRYNRLLHETIKEDEKKYAKEQEAKLQRRQRRSLRTLPRRKQVEASSSDEVQKPRRRTSSVLNLIRPRNSSSPSSNSSSLDSDDSSSDHNTQQPIVLPKPVFSKKYENYMHCID